MKAQLAAWPAVAAQSARAFVGRLATWARRTPTHRRLVAGAVLVAVALAAATGLVVSATSSYGDPDPPVHHARSGVSGNASLPMLGALAGGRVRKLPPATTTAAPAPPTLAAAAPMAAHEVFGFAPYWTLGQSTGFDLAGLTTVAYFAIGISPNGTLDESGSGWNGYGSQALVNLIDRAHAAGVRVVLTVNDFDQQSLDQLTASPTAANTLAQALIAAVQAKNLDGVNLDLEGTGSADQAGLTNLVTTVTGDLHQVDPHWQVTMDTYSSSATDPGGFYDIPALAQVVDGFFVMQYSPNLSGSAEPTSPLTSSLFSDLTTAKEYSAVVPAAKVILGAPFYGLDWPTTTGTLTAAATGTVTDLSYGQIAAAGHPVYWDPVTDSAWTAYQVGAQWHETFFDDPTSLYDISQLASQYGLAGVGIWALGMDGNDPAMVAALDGTAPAITYAPSPGAPPATTAAPSTTTSTTGPPSSPTTTVPAPAAGSPATTSTTTPPAATGTASTSSTTTSTTAAGSTTGGSGAGAGTPTYTAQGVWDAKTVSLAAEPAVAAATLDQPGAKKVGTLTGFTTTDPALSCLQQASSLAVWQLPATASATSTTTTSTSTTTTTTTQPGAGPQYTVVATQLTDCASAAFTFNPPAGTWSSGSTTSTSTSTTS